MLLSLLVLSACTKANIQIVPIGNKQIGVAQTLVFDVCATGAEGQSVTFTFDVPDLPSSGAQLSSYSAECARFSWTPQSQHQGIHAFNFNASAGGSTDTETINIDVMASSSAPVFLQPGAGGTYDLSRDPCVNVHIEVKDDDSLPASIRIFENDPPIEGGQMTQSGKSADWHWCPSPQQVEASDRYTLVLMAQDESHPAVSHDFVVVLRGAGKDDCPGAPPAIGSNSPPPPTLVASSRDYAVTATITDDRGIKEMPILYFSFDPPSNPDKPDVTTFQQGMFESQGGDMYVAYIPNPGLDPSTTRTVYYVISATDNDDETGVLCDHRVDSALFQFDITGGTDAPGVYCDRCSANIQCAGNACVVAAYPFCGAACAECPALGGECRDVTIMGGSVINLCVPAGLSCSGTTTCTDDGREENDTRATAASVTPNVYSGLVICPRDEDFYALTVYGSSSIDVMIDGWDSLVVDLDLQLLKPDGSILRTSAGLDNVEEVQACVAETGTYTIHVYGILDDTGPYSMLVDSYAGSCCVDDGYEPNNSYSQATPADTYSLWEGIICPSDSDWFSIYASSGQKLNADLLIEESGDLDLELYDTSGMLKLDGSYGTDYMEHVEYDIGAGGAYYARVLGYGGATSSYSLEFSFGTSSGCASTLACPAGTVCDGSSCIDDTCTPPGGYCPAGHFCPTPGGSDWISDCVDTCSSSSSCRDGYACKNFPEGSGCAGTGYGNPGDACYSFRSCGGEMTCLSWPGGYCAKMDCLYNSDCPTGSFCVEVTPGFSLGVCVQDCWASDDLCGLSEGYRCECVADLDGGTRFVCLAPGTSATPCY